MNAPTSVMAIRTTNPPITKVSMALHKAPTHIFEINGKQYACRQLPARFQNSEDYLATKSEGRLNVMVTYFASICGKIISRRGNGSLKLHSLHLKNNVKGSPRQHCVLTLDGVQENKYVHRLIASAFCANGYKRDANGHLRHMVNHIDENMLNNHASNLEWVSGKTNWVHSAYVTPAWRIERGDMTDSDRAALEVIEDFMAGEMTIATLIDVHGCGEVTRALRIAGFFDLTESASKHRNEDITYISRADRLASAI